MFLSWDSSTLHPQKDEMAPLIRGGKPLFISKKRCILSPPCSSFLRCCLASKMKEIIILWLILDLLRKLQRIQQEVSDKEESPAKFLSSASMTKRQTQFTFSNEVAVKSYISSSLKLLYLAVK